MNKLNRQTTETLNPDRDKILADNIKILDEVFSTPLNSDPTKCGALSLVISALNSVDRGWRTNSAFSSAVNAEDIMTEAYLKVRKFVAKHPTIRSRNTFQSLIYKAARSIYLDMLKTAKNHSKAIAVIKEETAYEEDQALDPYTAQNSFENPEKRAIMNQFFNSLTPRQLTVVKAIAEESTDKEIVEALYPEMSFDPPTAESRKIMNAEITCARLESTKRAIQDKVKYYVA
jgi:DNA-directed RNA polymerase specialized sigma24 family protein